MIVVFPEPLFVPAITTRGVFRVMLFLSGINHKKTGQIENDITDSAGFNVQNIKNDFTTDGDLLQQNRHGKTYKQKTEICAECT